MRARAVQLAGRPGRRLPGRHQHPLVALVSRLVIAQAVAAAAVGLPFSRRHLPSILITLLMIAAFCLLALLVRAGTRSAWMVALGVESLFFLYGVSRFVLARYVGGTLFALVITGILLHPAVARAYSVIPGGLSGEPDRDARLGDGTGETYGGRTAG